MTGKTHKQAGFAAAIGVSMIPAVNNLIVKAGTEEGLTILGILVTSSVFGALLSDIDNETSIISRTFPLISKLVTKKHQKVKGFRHRYFFHSLGFVLPFFIALAIFFFANNLVASSIFAGLGVGVLSHIAIDWIMSEVYLIPFVEHGFSLFHLEGNPEAQAKLDKVFRSLLYITNIFLIFVRFQ